MTTVRVQELGPGRIIDRACAEEYSRLVKLRREGRANRLEGVPEPIYAPSQHIAEAWALHEMINTQYFNHCYRYYEALDALVPYTAGYKIAWPWALSLLRPLHICQAFLIALNKEVIETDDED